MARLHTYKKVEVLSDNAATAFFVRTPEKKHCSVVVERSSRSHVFEIIPSSRAV